MNGKNESSFVARRTEALALILLASRPDLTVLNAPKNAGVDLIVSIDKNKDYSFNHFGVILKGTARKVQGQRGATRVLKSLIPRESMRTSPSMPICVFFFSMVGDQSYYSWLRQPVTSDGRPRLREHTSLECKPLDQTSLQAIVEDVDSYFDALSRVLVS